ncbi:MAG: EVE domain-containing protein [Planctomycetota bacterium]
MPSPSQYWLLKTEPESFSIQDLARSPGQTTCWDGVRNYQARNFMRDQMKVGDRVLIYHSNADPPCVVGTAVVARESYPDSSAWDPASVYYDADSKRDAPRWFMVDVKLDSVLPRSLPLDELRSMPKLAGMELLRKGSRLSVQPVKKAEFDAILAAARKPPQTRSS